jgi:hypothetical protein
MPPKQTRSTGAAAGASGSRPAPSGLSRLADGIWRGLPAIVGRVSQTLGAILGEGSYLRSWPLVGVVAPPAALAVGLVLGAGDNGLFSSSIAMVAVLAGIGAVSAALGLWAWVGFVIGDALLRDPAHAAIWSPPVPARGFAYLYAPLLISYITLAALVVIAPMVALTARSLAERSLTKAVPVIGPRTSAPTAAVVGVALQLIILALFALAWTRGAIVAVRPSWTYGHSVPHLAAIQALENGAAVLIAVVVGAGLAGTLVRRAAGHSARPAATDRRQAAPPRSQALAVAAVPLWAGVLAVTLSGLLTRPAQGLALAGVAAVVLLVRTVFLPRIGPLAETLRRVPLLLRAGLVPVASCGILAASGALSTTPPRGFNFSPMVLSALISLALASVLLTPELRRRLQIGPPHGSGRGPPTASSTGSHGHSRRSTLSRATLGLVTLVTCLLVGCLSFRGGGGTATAAACTSPSQHGCDYYPPGGGTTGGGSTGRTKTVDQCLVGRWQSITTSFTYDFGGNIGSVQLTGLSGGVVTINRDGTYSEDWTRSQHANAISGNGDRIEVVATGTETGKDSTPSAGSLIETVNGSGVTITVSDNGRVVASETHSGTETGSYTCKPHAQLQVQGSGDVAPLRYTWAGGGRRQPKPPATPSVLGPDRVTPGDNVRFDGSGFAPGPVTALIRYPSYDFADEHAMFDPAGDLHADAHGDVHVKFKWPDHYQLFGEDFPVLLGDTPAVVTVCGQPRDGGPEQCPRATATVYNPIPPPVQNDVSPWAAFAAGLGLAGFIIAPALAAAEVVGTLGEVGVHAAADGAAWVVDKLDGDPPR